MENYRISVNTFNEVAQQYQDKYMCWPEYTATYDALCDYLSPTARVLDIACGPGNIAHYLLTRYPQLDYLGIDLAPNMVTLAQVNNPKGQFKVMDSLDISRLSAQFDAMVCGFCLPYLNQVQVRSLLSSMAAYLEPNGLMYLSWIAGDLGEAKAQTSSCGQQVFTYYYPKQWLIDVLRQAYIEPLYLHRQQSPNGQDSELFMIGRRQR